MKKVIVKNVKIGEAYFKFNLPFSENKDRIKIELNNAISYSTKYIQEHDHPEFILSINKKKFYSVKYKINVEPGSTKGKISLYIALSTFLYQGVATYPQFKDGLNELIKDVQNKSEEINNSIVEIDNGITEDVIENFERRTGLPGKLKRILQSLEKYEFKNDLTKNEKYILNKAYNDLSNILAIMPDHEEKILRRSLNQKTLNNLPQPTQKGIQHTIKLYALKPAELDF